MATNYPSRPNCERLSLRCKDTQLIKDFLDFCLDSNVALMGEFRKFPHKTDYTPISEGRLQELMYAFIDVDPEELERERQQILDELRAEGDQKEPA